MSEGNKPELRDQAGRHDWNAKLMEFFVNNGRLVIMVAFAILIGGILSMVSLRREGFPEVPIKMLMVQTVYPGAGAEEVERKITKPLEDELKEAHGIEEIRSFSMNSVSSITVQLEQDMDLDQAAQEIRNKIITAESSLPEEAETPEVQRMQTGDSAYIIAISGGDDLAATQTTVINELSQVKGVKGVKALTDKPKRVIVEVDPVKLAQSGMSLDRLIPALKAANADFPVARLDIEGKNQNLSVIGSLTSLDDLKKTIISVNPLSGEPVRLHEIAGVKIVNANSDLIDRFGKSSGGKLDIHPGMLLDIGLKKGHDIIRTRDAVADRLKELKADSIIPKGTQTEFVYDNAVNNQKQVDEMASGTIGNRSNLWLLGGIQLVILVMLLFVNWRAALIAALSIPLSLGFTFIYLQMMDISLNTIVLFSLVLVLGLIVDPAIVIVESIQHFRDLGYKPREAVIATGRRYGAGVFMATLTNWIVFIPFGVVSGIFGEIIRYIPATVIPALLASYFIPVAILPWLTEKFLRPKPKESRNEEDSLWGAARAMIKINTWILARAWRGALVLFIAVGLTVMSISLVASGKVQVVQFATPEDTDILMTNITFKKGLTAKERDAIARKMESQLSKEKGVESFFYTNQTRDELRSIINLKEKRAKRDKSKKIVARLNRALGDEDRFDFNVSEISAGPPESEYNVQVQLYDNNLPALKKAAIDVGKYLQDLKGVEKVNDGVSSRHEPEVQVVLNRSEAEKRGISSIQVGQVLKTLVDETKLTKLEDAAEDRSYEVVMQIDSKEKPARVDDLKKLTVTDLTGKPVLLSDIAEIREVQGLPQIERFDGQRFLTVQALVDDKQLFDIQQKLDSYLSDDKIKELNISGKSNRGDFEEIAQSFTELFIALVIAIGLTYLVLVLQFRSFSQPMIMLFTIPPSLIGVFPALWILGTQLGFLELLGVTILVGIVENVAIFLIDYANQRIRQDGMDPKQAIILATGVRFRPIVLTKLVALGGLLPLAIESSFWRGLSVTIISGIGLSGLFSMMIIPILFTAIVSMKKRLRLQT